MKRDVAATEAQKRAHDAAKEKYAEARKLVKLQEYLASLDKTLRLLDEVDALFGDELKREPRRRPGAPLMLLESFGGHLMEEFGGIATEVSRRVSWTQNDYKETPILRRGDTEESVVERELLLAGHSSYSAVKKGARVSSKAVDNAARAVRRRKARLLADLKSERDSLMRSIAGKKRPVLGPRPSQLDRERVRLRARVDERLKLLEERISRLSV